ncbi:MAG: carbohydrate kinase [Planctomycetota bacterium]|nr:carbohydrate kinase [Planctomycetota bacterium]
MAKEHSHLDVICFGEALIDFVPSRSGVALRDADGFVRAAGGAPANVAAGLGKLGVKVAFMGMVGEDEFGAHLQEVLQASNVETSLMRTTGKANTTLAFVSLRADGERDFVFYRNPGADLLYEVSDVDASAFDRAKVFHFGSLSMTNQPCRSTTLHCLELARQKGLTVSYDPNWRSPLWPGDKEAREGMLLGLPFADWLKVSEEELQFIAQLEDEDRAVDRLMREGPSLVCVTRGADGASLWHDSIRIDMKGQKVKAVDTTGAGDAFWAAFIKKLLDNASAGEQIFTKEQLTEAMQYATVAGAVCVTGRGVIPSLPTADDIDDYNKRER